MLGETLSPSWFFFLLVSGAAVAACSGLLRALWWRRCGWSGSRSPRASGAEGSDQQAPGDEGRWRMLNCCLTKLDWLEHVWLAGGEFGTWGVAKGGGISGDLVHVCSSV